VERIRVRSRHATSRSPNLRCRLRTVRILHLPDAVKLNEIWLDRDAIKIGRQKFARAQKLRPVMDSFRIAVSLEMRQPAVGGAVGVTHDEHAFRLVEANRHAHLLENEILLEIVAGRRQRFRAACHDDHIHALDALLLEKLSHHLVNAVIETAKHGRIGDVLTVGRVEMEDLSHVGTILAFANAQAEINKETCASWF